MDTNYHSFLCINYFNIESVHYIVIFRTCTIEEVCHTCKLILMMRNDKCDLAFFLKKRSIYSILAAIKNILTDCIITDKEWRKKIFLRKKYFYRLRTKIYDIHLSYILLLFYTIIVLNFIRFNLQVPLRKRSNNCETQITIFLTLLPRLFILSILRDEITLPVKLTSSYTLNARYSCASASISMRGKYEPK